MENVYEMVEIPTPRVNAIYRYPVKGLSAEPLERVLLSPGQTVPFDRAYAIENGPGRFDCEAPRHLPKLSFLMLMRNARLATLQSEFDEADETLTIYRDGKQVARGELNTRLGRQLIEQFMASYMASDLRGRPKIVQAPGHSFSDVAAKCLHIVNLASVRDLERTLGQAIHPLRFRANIYLDGVEPWSELAWIHQEIHLGPAKLLVFARTGRCEATNVDPKTGARDMAIPSHLLRTRGHDDFGVYAKVLTGGEVRVGSPIRLPV